MQTPWLACPVPRPDAQVTIVSFPFAGAGCAAFASWGRLLDPRIEQRIVVLPGRERRLSEPAERDLSHVVKHLVEATRSLPHRKTLFFGHSLGALIAFELTRALQAVDRAPHRLIVSSRGAPTVTDRHPAIHDLSDDDAFVNAMHVRYGGIPDVVRQNKELMALFIPALRGDMALHCGYTYQPGPQLKIPLTAWCGRSDPGSDAPNTPCEPQRIQREPRGANPSSGSSDWAKAKRFSKRNPISEEIFNRTVALIKGPR